LFYRQIRVPIVNQNNHNLLPFSWIKESGMAVDLGNDAKLGFVIEGSNTPYLNYEAVLNRDNSSITATPDIDTPTVYIQNDTDVTREAEIYVDVIAQDANGIRDIRVHTEPNGYDFEKVNNVFYIPKFTWDTSADTTTTTTTQIVIDSLLVGTEDGRFLEMNYDIGSPSILNQFQLTSPINNIICATDKSGVYISTNSDLYIYGVEYFNDGSNIYQKKEVTNTNSNVMSLYGSIWSVQAYSGKVVKMDDEELTVQKEYSGFDAPFKVVDSVYHGLKFVAGTNILWSINENSGVTKAVYEINGFTIADFDISPEGQVCVLFNGNAESIIRVLDTDLYSILLDKHLDSNSNVRYCQYIGEGKFYILSELETGNFTYSSDHYVFDINTNNLEVTSSSTDLISITTTTTLGVTTKAVAIESPNGGEQIQTGEEYEIKWISSKSATDLVKLELYKSGELHSTIASETVNDGLYAWQVPTNLDGSDYRVRVTWLSASSDTNNYDSSDTDFTIAKDISITTTTTTAELTEYSVGIDHNGNNGNNDTIVVVLKSGLYGVFDLVSGVFDGLYSLGVTGVTSFVLRDLSIGGINVQTKLRVWVGSDMYLSDKWYAEIETGLRSIYYGGGNNLQGGKKYYVHIQTYDENEGWGVVQVSDFVMLK